MLSLTTVETATSRELHAAALSDHSLSAPALGGVPGDVLARVQATPGVRAAAPVATTTVLRTDTELGEKTTTAAPALILTPEAPAVLDLEVREGRLTDLTRDTVAIGRGAARSSGARVGRRIDLVLGDDTRVRPRVVAIYDRDLAFGPVALSRDLTAGHLTNGLAENLLVRTDGSPRARRALAALAASSPGVALARTDADAASGRSAGLDANAQLNLAVVAVLLVYLLLGVANKTVAATAQCSGEIRTLRLVGATKHQVRAMMRREATIVAVAALATGLLLSLVPLALLSIGFVGRPYPAGPVWLTPMTMLVVATVAFLTVDIPTRRMLRGEPIRA